MSRDTACIVQFENEQTRELIERGWSLDIIDMIIWRVPVDGWIATKRYVVRVRRTQKSGRGTYGTHADGDTPEDAVAAMVQRLKQLGGDFIQ